MGFDKMGEMDTSVFTPKARKKLEGMNLPKQDTPFRIDKEASGKAMAMQAKFGSAKQYVENGKVIVPGAKTDQPKATEFSAAPDKKALLEAQKEINRLQEQEAALAQKRFDDYLSILPPNLQLIEIKREMLRLEQDKAALIGPGLDEDRIKLETELLNLGKQRRDAERDLVAEKDRAAEIAKAEAEQATQQGDALAAFQDEMDLINAKIAGNKELVAELQRQAEIQQIVNQLMDQAGLSEADALTKAQQMVDAKRALESQATQDTSGKIKGYSRERQGGADEARQRAEDRVNAARNKRDQAVDDAFGGLTPKDQAQQNPLAPQAQRNAAAQDQGRGNTDNTAQLGQQILAVIQQMLTAVQ